MQTRPLLALTLLVPVPARVQPSPFQAAKAEALLRSRGPCPGPPAGPAGVGDGGGDIGGRYGWSGPARVRGGSGRA